MRIPKKYQDRVSDAFKDDGWWIYLGYGWRVHDNLCHTIHEDTQSRALEVLRKSVSCNCNECIEGLKAKRAKLISMNKKEYKTKGNTQMCQKIWAEIEQLDHILEEVQNGI